QWLKDEGNKTLLGQCVGFFGGPIFRRLKKNIKKAQRGGALLLGLKKPLVIAHGSADGQTMHEAIMFAHAVVTQNFYAAYLEEVERLLMHTTISLQQSRQKTVGA